MTSGVRTSEPFLKWAGGKRRLLPDLLDAFPALTDGATYFEPFLGGGAAYFALTPRNARLGDINGELVEAFIAVRDDVDAVIEAMKRLRWNKDEYYRIRSSRPRLPTTRAARFIYLNKTCFNGLFRVNLAGDFNVPFGRHPENHVVCDEDQLRAASTALQSAVLVAADFVDTVQSATEGDLAYFDPPYTTSHSNNGFIEYNAKVFAWDDQRRLAEEATRLVDAGVNVVVSNAEHKSIVELYEDAGLQPQTIGRWSTMAGSAKSRVFTNELLFVAGPGFQVAADG